MQTNMWFQLPQRLRKTRKTQKKNRQHNCQGIITARWPKIKTSAATKQNRQKNLLRMNKAGWMAPIATPPRTSGVNLGDFVPRSLETPQPREPPPRAQQRTECNKDLEPEKFSVWPLARSYEVDKGQGWQANQERTAHWATQERRHNEYRSRHPHRTFPLSRMARPNLS